MLYRALARDEADEDELGAGAPLASASAAAPLVSPTTPDDCEMPIISAIVAGGGAAEGGFSGSLSETEEYDDSGIVDCSPRPEPNTSESSSASNSGSSTPSLAPAIQEMPAVPRPAVAT